MVQVDVGVLGALLPHKDVVGQVGVDSLEDVGQRRPPAVDAVGEGGRESPGGAAPRGGGAHVAALFQSHFMST